jgi:hypothetical protein
MRTKSTYKNTNGGWNRKKNQFHKLYEIKTNSNKKK